MSRFFTVIGFTFLFTSFLTVMTDEKVALYLALLALVSFLTVLLIKPLRKNAVLLTVLICICLSSTNTYFRTSNINNKIMILKDKTVEVTAYAIDQPIQYNTYYLYTFKTTNVGYKDAAQKIKFTAFSKQNLNVSPFEIIKATLVFSGDYSEKTNGYGEGIYLSSFISSPDIIKTTGETKRTVAFYGSTVRNYSKNTISDIMPSEHSSLIKGLLFSDKSDMSKDLCLNFQRTGLVHTTSVSGLHVTILLSFVFFVLSKFNISRKARTATGILFTVLFMLFIGFQFSVIRACAMALILLTADLIYRENDSINSLGLVALILILINPYSAVNVGFLLSFLATLGMILIYPFTINFIKAKIKIKKTKLKNAVITMISPFVQSLSATVLVLPILIIVFKGISLVMPIANMLVIPIISLIMIFSLLTIITAALPGIYVIFALPTLFFTDLTIEIVDALSKISIGYVGMDYEYIGLFIAATIVMSAVLLYLVKIKGSKHSKKLMRLTALLLLNVFLLTTFINVIMNNNLTTVTFLNSGEGTATVISEGNDAIVIGLGGKRSDNSLEQVVTAKNIYNIDLIMLPYVSNNYSHNAESVVKYYQPKKMLMDVNDDAYYSFASVYNNEILSVDNCSVNALSGVTIKTIAQLTSTIVFVQIGETTLLYVDENTKIDDLDNEYLKIDVLVVCSKPPENIEKVKCRYAVVCTAKPNAYGLNKKFDTFVTAQSGNIRLITRKNGDLKFRR